MDDWERIQGARRHFRNEGLIGCAYIFLGSLFIGGLIGFPPLALVAVVIAAAWFYLARRRR